MEMKGFAFLEALPVSWLTCVIVEYIKVRASCEALQNLLQKYVVLYYICDVL